MQASHIFLTPEKKIKNKKILKKSQLHDVPEIAKHCTHIIKQGFSGALYYVPHAFLQNSQLTQYRCYWEPLSIVHVDKLQACSSEGEIASYMKLATSNPLISSFNTITRDAIPYEDVLLGMTPVVGSPRHRTLDSAAHNYCLLQYTLLRIRGSRQPVSSISDLLTLIKWWGFNRREPKKYGQKQPTLCMCMQGKKNMISNMEDAKLTCTKTH